MRAACVAVVVAACLGLLGLTPGTTADAAVQMPEEITYTYCVRPDGVADSEVDGFAERVGEILADPHGWGLDGALELRRRGGCDTDFTVWLSTPERVAELDAACSARWSCRVGRHVVINAERWHHASEAWDEAGASLDDYRRMVVNHEVGHWLGFDHAECPEAGASAPVMQQQSIGLEGCEPNTRPGAADRAELAYQLGLEPPTGATSRAGSAPRTADDEDGAQH